MPELPEVETTRLGIAPHVAGRQVRDVVVRNHQLRWPVDKALARQLSGRKLQSVGRRGKYLLCRFSHGHLLIHLGMSGSLRLVDPDVPAARHDHVDLVLSGKRVLRYTDPRRFGAWLWHAAEDGPVEAHPLLARLGPEPLEDEFNAGYLFRQTRRRKVACKQWLMDSHQVVGVGNIYANEALFRAGIRPGKAAGRLTRQESEALVVAVKRVLGEAIAQGGTTLKDFVGGDGKPGYFKQSLAVYGREGEPCLQCGEALRGRVMGGRQTVWCSRCQQ